MPRKPKLKNPNIPTGKEPGVQYVNLSPDPSVRHFGHEMLAGYPHTGYNTCIITVWLAKDETAWNPASKERFAFQGPGKVKYTVWSDDAISAEFVGGS